MSRRRRRRGVGVGWVLGIFLLGIGAVVGVTIALDSFVPGYAVRPMCVVEASAGGEVRLSPTKMENAALITGVGLEMGVGERAVVIALATAMQESSLRNLDYGDRDSLGLFQQRPSQGWGTAEQVQDRVYASRTFYEHLLKVPGYDSMPLTEAAQAVQISAFPNAYAKHEGLAQALFDALAGARPAALTCSLRPSEGLLVDGLVAELAEAHPGAQASRVGPSVVLGGDVDPWVLAHWAVSSAERTGVESVRIGSREWTRAGGWAQAGAEGGGSPAGEGSSESVWVR